MDEDLPVLGVGVEAGSDWDPEPVTKEEVKLFKTNMIIPELRFEPQSLYHVQKDCFSNLILN